MDRRSRVAGWRRRPVSAFLVVVGAVAIQAPWIARNQWQNGTWLPTRVGENLYVSTSPLAWQVVPDYDIDVLVPLAYRQAEQDAPAGASRADLDRILFAKAVSFAFNHPVETARLKLRNLFRLFDPRLLPRHPTGEQAAAHRRGTELVIEGLRKRPWIQEASHAIAKSIVLCLAAFAFWRRGVAEQDAPLLLFITTQCALCVIFFPTTRLLAPAATLLMAYAGAGADALLSGTTGRT